MIKFSQLISNYKSQNTPDLAHKIGNIALICAGLSISILGFPTLMQEAGFEGIVLPVFAIKAAKILAAIGVFGKIITKLFGNDQEAIGQGVPSKDVKAQDNA